MSNTVMVPEWAGRPGSFVKGGKQLSSSTPGYTATAIADQTNFSGGGWVDPNNAQFIQGGNPSGWGYGTCPINCNNEDAAGYYSFHTGGAHALMGDGTVRFLSENIGFTVFQALNTRAAGDIVGSF